MGTPRHPEQRARQLSAQPLGVVQGAQVAQVGSCLCSRVRFEVLEPLRPFGNCHCSMCRKATGAAFWTCGPATVSSFSWLSGEDTVAWYESSPGSRRGFCSNCGSTLVMRDRAFPDTIGFSIAALDTNPATGPVMNIFVGSKAPWFDITDALPSYHEVPPHDAEP